MSDIALLFRGFSWVWSDPTCWIIHCPVYRFPWERWHVMRKRWSTLLGQLWPLLLINSVVRLLHVLPTSFFSEAFPASLCLLRAEMSGSCSDLFRTRYNPWRYFQECVCLARQHSCHLPSVEHAVQSWGKHSCLGQRVPCEAWGGWEFGI